MLKDGIETVVKNRINYCVINGQKKTYKPWLGDAFSFLYDRIMEKSIFPKMFDADIKRHYEILKDMIKDIHGKKVLELATGSGSAVNFLPSDNSYTGSDISQGLLKIAARRFGSSGFKDPSFYLTGAEDLPFRDNQFDIVLCILSLNFFSDLNTFFQEIGRVGRKGAEFICSITIPERKTLDRKIHGTLFSEKELEEICRQNGFAFTASPERNGSLLYFKAVRLS